MPKQLVAEQTAPDVPLTPADDFRQLRLHGRVTTLQSSGRVVRWRPVNLARMLKAGKIPDYLTNFVASMTWEGEEKDERSTAEKGIEWQNYLDWISQATLMSPRVVDEPRGADEIAVEDLFYEEQIELDRLARYPLQAVRPFRVEQEGSVGVGEQGEQDEPVAK